MEVVRNSVNRQINARLANQLKAASAAVETNLRHPAGEAEHYGMEDFCPSDPGLHPPPGSPTPSVAELGQRATPPPFQSAVYHRVRRLGQ